MTSLGSVVDLCEGEGYGGAFEDHHQCSFGGYMLGAKSPGGLAVGRKITLYFMAECFTGVFSFFCLSMPRGAF